MRMAATASERSKEVSTTLPSLFLFQLVAPPDANTRDFGRIVILLYNLDACGRSGGARAFPLRTLGIQRASGSRRSARGGRRAGVARLRPSAWTLRRAPEAARSSERRG